MISTLRLKKKIEKFSTKLEEKHHRFALNIEEFFKVSKCKNAKNISKSSNNYIDINTCIMVDVDHTSNFIQATYYKILDAFGRIARRRK